MHSSDRHARPTGPPHERIVAEVPRIERAELAVLEDLASNLGQTPKLKDSPLMDLTARQPYDATYGNVDVYMPGRWDTSSNLIYMDTIRQVGSSPGEWEGSVAYVEFKPPASGTYLVVGTFTGYQTTAHLVGPWGEATAYTAQTSDTGTVLGLASESQQFEFTLNFTVANNGYGLGYIESVQVYAMS